MVKAVCPSLRGSDFLKVPKEYKSSDRFNAGVDVIYDDDSKLQYAPFIYAGVTAGDNGGDGGEEEGEDVMVVKYDENTGTYDKTWKEVSDAVTEGKLVMAVNSYDAEKEVYYLTRLFIDDGAVYTADFSYNKQISSSTVAPLIFRLTSDSENGYLEPVAPK